MFVMQFKMEVGGAVGLDPEDLDFYLQCAAF